LIENLKVILVDYTETFLESL